MRTLLVLFISACGGAPPPRPPPTNVTPPTRPAAPSPTGAWSAPGLMGESKMLLCVIDHGFGISGKRASKAADIAASGQCTWTDDGKGHCNDVDPDDMHSAFDLTWKLSGDELTLSRATDLIDKPVVFRRDSTIDCTPTKKSSQDAR